MCISIQISLSTCITYHFTSIHITVTQTSGFPSETTTASMSSMHNNEWDENEFAFSTRHRLQLKLGQRRVTSSNGPGKEAGRDAETNPTNSKRKQKSKAWQENPPYTWFLTQRSLLAWRLPASVKGWHWKSNGKSVRRDRILAGSECLYLNGYCRLSPYPCCWYIPRFAQESLHSNQAAFDCNRKLQHANANAFDWIGQHCIQRDMVYTQMMDYSTLKQSWKWPIIMKTQPGFGKFRTVRLHRLVCSRHAQLLCTQTQINAVHTLPPNTLSLAHVHTHAHTHSWPGYGTGGLYCIQLYGASVCHHGKTKGTDESRRVEKIQTISATWRRTSKT